jgi:hypothetical protein
VTTRDEVIEHEVMANGALRQLVAGPERRTEAERSHIITESQRVRPARVWCVLFATGRGPRLPD